MVASEPLRGRGRRCRSSPGRASLADPEGSTGSLGAFEGESVGEGGTAAGGASRGRGPLDQRRENRETVDRVWTPLVDVVPDGALVMGAVRSGGAFDPLGCRAVDVTRADDVVACVDEHPGRWLMITLTVDRSAWIGPEACYQRVADRVREVARVVSLEGIHVTALELQGKTGDGWPHWHLIVWAPDDRPLEDIRRRVRRAWSITTEHVDEETGEVTRSIEPIAGEKGIDVQAAVERQGVARYAAKYLLKPWEAVPSWMGQSRRQLRKLRISSGVFDWLESQGRHLRHRGGRRCAQSRRRPARRLFERMARSGLSHAVFRRQGSGFKFVRLVPIPTGDQSVKWFHACGAEPVRMGDWRSMRWLVSPEGLGRLGRRWTELVAAQRREYEFRRYELESGWARMQAAREAPDPVVCW